MANHRSPKPELPVRAGAGPNFNEEQDPELPERDAGRDEKGGLAGPKIYYGRDGDNFDPGDRDGFVCDGR